MINKVNPHEARVDFSFNREVFFIIAGGIIGVSHPATPISNKDEPSIHDKRKGTRTIK